MKTFTAITVFSILVLASARTVKPSNRGRGGDDSDDKRRSSTAATSLAPPVAPLRTDDQSGLENPIKRVDEEVDNRWRLKTTNPTPTPANTPRASAQAATANQTKNVDDEGDNRRRSSTADPSQTPSNIPPKTPARVGGAPAVGGGNDERDDGRRLSTPAQNQAATTNSTRTDTPRVQPPRGGADERDDRPRGSSASGASATPTTTAQSATAQSTACIDRFIRVDNATHSCDLLLTTSRMAFDLNKEFWCNQYSRTECCATCARIRQEGQIS